MKNSKIIINERARQITSSLITIAKSSTTKADVAEYVNKYVGGTDDKYRRQDIVYLLSYNRFPVNQCTVDLIATKLFETYGVKPKPLTDEDKTVLAIERLLVTSGYTDFGVVSVVCEAKKYCYKTIDGLDLEPKAYLGEIQDIGDIDFD